MPSAIVIIDKAPYGCENALSGIYVALAAMEKNIDTDVLLIGEGVYAALKNQRAERSIHYPSVGELIYSLFPNANLYVYAKSLIEKSIEYEDLIETAELIEDKSLLEILESKNHVLKI